MPTTQLLAGMVLCRVGPHRLAFPAAQVVSVTPWKPGDRGFPDVRAVFDTPCGAGRTVLSEEGAGVVVDAIEVYAPAVPMLPAPSLLAKEAGGSLRGFASAKDLLWPVLGLTDFSRFLSTLP